MQSIHAFITIAARRVASRAFPSFFLPCPAEKSTIATSHRLVASVLFHSTTTKYAIAALPTILERGARLALQTLVVMMESETIQQQVHWAI